MDRSRRTKADPSKPCFGFLRGKCHFGSRCKFSHPINAPVSSSFNQPHFKPGATTRKERNVPEANRLQELKRLVHPGLGSSRPNQDICDRFFHLALELMNGDVGASQETIRTIAGEDGLSFIRNLAEHHIPLASDRSAKARVWLHQVRPLFSLVTHQRVITSAVLEQEVATIYNFMRGIGGKRMKNIFGFVTSLLEVWSVLPIQDAPESGLAVAELCLAVLAKMIDCNTTNIVDDTFPPILQQLEAFVVAKDDSSDAYYKLQAQKHIQYIQLRLGVGEALPSQNLEKQTAVIRAEFLIRKDLPGRLSSQGPRHDNDFDNICDIRILPTQQEIVSVRGEYLPTNAISQFHIPGICGRLDREFRLLREDTVGQLRDAVRAQLELMCKPEKARKDKNSVRTYTYNDANVRDIGFDRLNGLDLLVQFRQPASAKEKQKRQDWWIHSKRLQPGALVCILPETGPVLFCVVADTTIVTVDHKLKTERKTQKDQNKSDQGEKPSLAADTDFAYVHLHIADTERDNVFQALRWFRNIGHQKRRCVVEFPGVLLPSFKYTLEALQRLSARPNLPFSGLLAPSQPGLSQAGEGFAEVPPPQYSMKQGFSFDLTCITKDKTTLTCSPRKPLSPEELAAHSTLDTTQSGALLDALSKSLALIQGPPGTGKSFTGEKLIKVLLANKGRAKLGPVLCVCYTNHALDQLLEHLYDDGVEQIVRIGSRSKSEKLESVNLRIIARTADRTKTEKHSLWLSNEQLDDNIKTITASIKELKSAQSWKIIKEHLAQHYPRHHAALFGSDEDGFQTVRRRPDQIINQWCHQGRTGGSSEQPPRHVDDLVHVDLDTLSRSERTRLYNHWLKEIQTPIFNRIQQDHKAFVASKDLQDKVRRDVDLRCLSEADVIGVTTTGLARNLYLLQKVTCKVLLCEEAGEVLEAHTLTALLPSVEHAILIGDHQQLRPQIQNYDLQSTNPRGEQYSLDVSLFERLVNPPYDDDLKLPFSTLKTQRRMHPSIAELIRSTIYPSLEDGGSVHQYPKVLGIKKHLFWLHHESLEDKATQVDTTTTSHTNAFEVEMTVALVQHLVRQGSYGPNDIAVITPYLGQLQRLRRLMERMFEITVGDRDLEELEAFEASGSGNEAEATPKPKALVSKTTLLKSIRLATVDNFQGEEAKVVVISLVRSNEQSRCGFLSTPNRINVLLSRAKYGMYLIGNANTYGHVPMWAQVLSILKKSENLGTELELQCSRHPDAPMLVSQPDHFLRLAPEGGCNLSCDSRLYCGHSCINRCHSEMLHNAVKCLEPCPRPKQGCDHSCPLRCGDACEPICNKRLRGISLTLPCGHEVSSAFCWQAQDPATITCNVNIKRTVPGCKHVVVVPCHIDVEAEGYICRAICGDHQNCGHSCRSACHQCKKRSNGKITEVNHGICKQPCGRGSETCRHACRQACHGEANCPPCLAPCEVRCSHSRCSKKCHEPCDPCAEQSCASCCPHSQCTMPCAAPCNWIPCSIRCGNILGCGHQCPSLCGEPCPDAQYCQVCCSDDIKSTTVDFIMGCQYNEVELNEDPCIFPDCGHFFTKASMDGHMDLKAHYRLSDGDNPVAISSKSRPFSMDEIKVCPSCRASLRNIARYGRIVRRAMLDEATKKFITWSNTEYHILAERLTTVQQELSESTLPRAMPQPVRPAKLIKAQGRLKQLYAVRDWVGTDRYKQALSLWHLISEFMGKVRKEEQPFQRVANFVQHAARQRQTQEHFTFDDSLIHVKGELQASALWLRCETIIFADFIRMAKVFLVASFRPEIELDFSKQMKDCEALVKLAQSTKHPIQEVEGHVYLAQFCALARALAPETAPLPTDTSDSGEVRLKEQPTTARDKLKEQAAVHIAAARELLLKYPKTGLLAPVVEAAEIMLRDSVSYAVVSADEMRAVYKAMASEFRGTGHWYTCENGHPFTVGECGMPMEQARCPECGGVVGGSNHAPAEGVTNAGEIDNLERIVTQLRV